MRVRSLASLYKTSKPERIEPPAAKLASQQAKVLAKGGPKASAAGRILAELSVAKRQHARRPKP
jgi:hypothetical protein